MTGPVTAGVDGSPSSIRAAELAAEEARLRRRALRLVHAFSWPPVPIGEQLGGAEPVGTTLHGVAEKALAESVARARAVAPDIEVTGDLVDDEPLPALTEAAASASLVAVGCRGLGRFAGLLVGSVALHLATHAPCPVLIARGEPDPDGPVVLGTDGSGASARATGFALEEAALHGAPLAAVHVRPDHREAPAPDSPTTVAAGADPVLDEALAPWEAAFPGVTVERRSARGRTREALIRSSGRARLLVVGRRGRGGFTGLLLGSVSQAVVQHADCPVLVVPPHAEDGPGEE